MLISIAMDAKESSLMLATSELKLLLHTASYGLSDGYIRKDSVAADRSITEDSWGVVQMEL